MATTKKEEKTISKEEKTINIEDLAQMMAGMKEKLEQLESENKELKAAKTETPTPVKNTAIEELVPIHLFKDKNMYKDDVFIAINGQRVQIQRGTTVMLPKKYANVLERSMKQDAQTADLIEEETSYWENKAKVLGL